MIHIPIAVVKTVFSGKLGSLFLCFAAIAVTEAFLGQMVIALIVALIGAAPPTVAIILASRKQSSERAASQASIIKGQEDIGKALDGKLSELVTAKQDVARAEGKEQERTEERERVSISDALPPAAAVAAVIHQAAQAAADAVKADPDQISKMLLVNDDASAVPTREAKPVPPEKQEEK